MLITILYDNSSGSGLKKGWGFCCLIETDKKKILFDTGWDGNLLLDNMKDLGIDVKQCDILVISHQHWDHIGGLPSILNANPEIEVYVPSSFSEKLKNEIKERAELHQVSEMCEITDNVYSTGEMGTSIKEQALILKTEKGTYAISGCAHPGISPIIEVASSIGNVRGIIGGLHNSTELEAMKGLELIGAGHCTSEITAIKKRYPKSFVPIEVGYQIQI